MIAWTKHVASVFCKMLRLTFVFFQPIKIRVLLRLVPEFIISFIFTHWLYYSPLFFLSLKWLDFILIVKSLKLLTRCGGSGKGRIADYFLHDVFSTVINFQRVCNSTLTSVVESVVSIFNQFHTSSLQFSYLHF